MVNRAFLLCLFLAFCIAMVSSVPVNSQSTDVSSSDAGDIASKLASAKKALEASKLATGQGNELIDGLLELINGIIGQIDTNMTIKTLTLIN
ncbi:uncharacterized protein BX664DRAFT_387043 [Halteromyces radiatus]|uniref:uncharacterized protein n=1 Tax=Halteromyces radiatus TaxID=101107 RepID=UPI00221EB957|nr:uncharacterized protein BX664DRAFT_387043 [Halteromyces radiatus]KAI8086664.1 hypothetical protein BX664DRAFT_387043 [Halteromyces radiatus]